VFNKEGLQKIRQLTHRYERTMERQLYKQGLTKMSLRKAHTRTKIMLGGLVVKAGLLDPLNIPLGADLQKDEQHFDNVTTLIGALCDLKTTLQQDEAQKLLWKERGKKALAE